MTCDFGKSIFIRLLSKSNFQLQATKHLEGVGLLDSYFTKKIMERGLPE